MAAIGWWIYGGVCLVMSLITVVIYGWDKRQSRRHEARRVRERTLHTLELLGGWPGGIAARRLWRHKTVKLRFRIMSWLIITLHLAAIAALIWHRN
jgi:uncharacterized membrane protein YsdA (DUF1294 family)